MGRTIFHVIGNTSKNNAFKTAEDLNGKKTLTFLEEAFNICEDLKLCPSPIQRSHAILFSYTEAFGW